MRTGAKLGDQQMVDGMIKDGLWCSSCNVHMGGHAEHTARKANVSREDQDRFAADSHKKAICAIDSGKFKEEIVPVEIAGKKGSTIVDTDESPRRGRPGESLSKRRPACPGRGDNKDWSVTAGNASSLNDGASALVVVSEAYA